MITELFVISNILLNFETVYDKNDDANGKRVTACSIPVASSNFGGEGKEGSNDNTYEEKMLLVLTELVVEEVHLLCRTPTTRNHTCPPFE